MSDVINKKQLALFTKVGLTEKIRTTISAVQGLNSTLYLTSGDIAFEMIKRCHPGVNVNRATFIATTSLVSISLSIMLRSSNSSIFKCPAKLQSTRAGAVYKSLKRSFAYRIGMPIEPVINADIAAERRNGRGVEAVVEDTPVDESLTVTNYVEDHPVETILSIIPYLTMAQLTQVAVEILAAKDDLFLQLQQDQFSKALDNPRSTRDLIEELESGRSHS